MAAEGEQATIDCVIMRGGTSENDVAIHGDAALLRRFAEVRGRAAVLLGCCDDWRQADRLSPGLPMVGAAAPPDDCRTLNGAPVAAAEADLRVRLMFMGCLHESIAGTGSMCLAAASRVPGSVVHAVVANPAAPTLRIGHPSGAMTVEVVAVATDAPSFVRFPTLGMARTARRLARCTAYDPVDLAENSHAGAVRAPAEVEA